MESYPPLFRNPTANLDSIPTRYPNLDLPIINLAHLDQAQLGEACRELGLFRLINHGIPSPLAAQLHAESKRILSLPFESKRAGLVGPVSYFWGSPVVSLSVGDVNWLEAIHAPLGKIQEVGDDLGLCSSFRSLAYHYGLHMARISKTIFDALLTDLKLDTEVSSSYLHESDGILRVYRYPCCPETMKYLGMVAHTDSSVLSILNQVDVGGLQVLHNDQWFNVEPISETLVVNLGDMMQAMSNDEYKSVEHRVLASGSKERMSLCYFAFPKEDAVIVNSKYKAFTYKEFSAKVREDTKLYGYKVGLEHFMVKKQT
ncbi:gibberellin 2-beta-dioxygenase 8-like [Asparagus officinalis]|uniref:gibberellin 2-beta-dioxygenase 8-like n=1 Tax=Asparagus officinalis TaxID=4686 RepID=UPI00098E481D|nr:gibberellin 2-beta-dioxygenase 8-like [Asparagus officinalis]